MLYIQGLNQNISFIKIKLSPIYTSRTYWPFTSLWLWFI